jgi:hypothetical protein
MGTSLFTSDYVYSFRLRVGDDTLVVTAPGGETVELSVKGIPGGWFRRFTQYRLEAVSLAIEHVAHEGITPAPPAAGEDHDRETIVSWDAAGEVLTVVDSRAGTLRLPLAGSDGAFHVRFHHLVGEAFFATREGHALRDFFRARESTG